MTVADKKVLVVSHEETIREGCRTALNKAGFTVEVAGSGQDALAAVQTKVFHLVVADAETSDVDTGELLKTLRQRSAAAQGVLLGGKAGELDVFEVLDRTVEPERLCAVAVAAVLAPKKSRAARTAESAGETTGEQTSPLKALLLLVVSPVLGFTYLMVLPLVGFVAVVVTAFEALGRLFGLKKSSTAGS